jgi:hypothetical protein
VQVGTRLVVAVTARGDPAGCIDSLGNTYTLHQSVLNPGTGWVTAVYSAESATAGANTVTVGVSTGGVDGWTLRLYELEGIDHTDPIVGTAAMTANTTTPSSGSVTPDADGCLFFGTMEGQAPIVALTPFNAGVLESPVTNVQDVAHVQATAAALAATWTDGTGRSYATLTVFRPAVDDPPDDDAPLFLSEALGLSSLGGLH